MNRLGKRIQELFISLDRRLKSADKKEQSGVRGEGRDNMQTKQKTKTDQRKQTSSKRDSVSLYQV